jgi:hypothetical protein
MVRSADFLERRGDIVIHEITGLVDETSTTKNRRPLARTPAWNFIWRLRLFRGGAGGFGFGGLLFAEPGAA